MRNAKGWRHFRRKRYVHKLAVEGPKALALGQYGSDVSILSLRLCQSQVLSDLRQSDQPRAIWELPNLLSCFDIFLSTQVKTPPSDYNLGGGYSELQHCYHARPCSTTGTQGITQSTCQTNGLCTSHLGDDYHSGTGWQDCKPSPRLLECLSPQPQWPMVCGSGHITIKNVNGLLTHCQPSKCWTAHCHWRIPNLDSEVVGLHISPWRSNLIQTSCTPCKAVLKNLWNTHTD